ncbi:ygbP [Wigglesworthia glossinidia endosymbiont of Glossina brevipalpis]|uniref:2-C-methyl-D-erythritol 4-phosphate cytidylyltransferase n=1 Tax=Wigglesworthia glossinidia brevipalpis TaxID=36870 RepID=ISPD_WIGBR|nr:RecName: Full=2-C-methyl-D-erythritol 4-phosphate cytidylyltransferase; AltName: Full=4-diphosphocytidyl-2C-methyl-D-erythritol synthase; AltName: Full=MEP cytidylyltransferase; Short=MCT [Wigglesworthia glossinidia endosymbiont of Glossina brevipalpis]BAC24678.1 ygbP [Wigglesworthia glossinidia endosymbiont of Glossina brevipalpis]
MINHPEIIVIFPAAGIGKRMGYKYPKQYIKIKNKTILEHSISLFIDKIYVKKILIAINKKDYWFNKLSILKNKKINIVIGGKSRTESVISALKFVSKVDWVLVHDAVRPCLHKNDLNKLLKVINISPFGAILAAPIYDTVKKSYGNFISHTIKRNKLWRALTPQLFNLKILINCLKIITSKGEIITDESSALEKCGYKLNLVHGRSDNIKITYPEDLNFANFFINNIKE